MSTQPDSYPELEPLVREMLTVVGEDPDREGLLRTPTRVAKSMAYLTHGYEQDLSTIVNGAVFHEEADDMVLVKDIEFYSMCEHHMLPFYGRVHIGYLPNKSILGLSKLPRIVEMFARRLQVQERMTTQIAEAVHQVLAPKGVAVVAEAAHLCMMMRGVAKQASETTTYCMLGAFRKESMTRSEFFSLIR